MSALLTQADGDIFRITINRPEHGNTVSDEMAAELTEHIKKAGETSRLIVFRGAGEDFCLGRATMGVPSPGPIEAIERRRTVELIFDCYGAFRGSKIPVIGVVQGRAAGFGCALAAVCDITLASDRATFQVPEMQHNILPTMVLSSFVDRVTRKGTAYMVYSTFAMSAERALSYGLVSDVVPHAELDQRLDDLCAAILQAPPIAVEGVKEYLRTALDMSTPGAIDYARNLHATINSASEIRKKSSRAH